MSDRLTSLFSYFQHSLVRRMVLQITLLGIIAIVVVGIVINAYKSQELDEDIHRRAIAIFRLLQNSIDTNANSPEMRRDVATLAAEGNVRSIVVTQEQSGVPVVIAASTAPDWVGKPLSQAATKDIRADIQRVYAAGAPISHYHDDLHFEYAALTVVPTHDRLHSTRWVSHLILDAAPLYADVKTDIAAVLFILTLALIGIAASLYWIMKRNIFAPLENLKGAMESQAMGYKDAYAHVYHPDEIGRAAQIFNTMMDTLTKKQERLDLAVSGTMDGLWDWNVETNEVYYSPRFMALTGHTPHELPHSVETFNTLLHAEDRANVHMEIAKHFKGRGLYSVEYRLRHKNGDYIWCHARGQASWNTQGKAVRMTGFTMDITERKQAETQLKVYAARMEDKSRELAAAKAQAEQAARLKSEFLANMSHEIRTPMNGVIGMTNLLLECELDAVERRYAETISQSAESLLQIINDILDFSKIEAGRIDLEDIPFDLQLLAEEVCHMMAFKAAEKNIEFLLRYPPSTPRYVVGDPGRVRQILFNLVNNAIKFTDKGHVILSLQCDVTTDKKLNFRIEVEDTGIGIPADKTDYIFNKFSQADSSTTRKFGGTGLGLSICKELVQMMGGNIGVRTKLGVGSTFYFTMQLTADAANAVQFPIPQAAILKGLRALVVDDNAAARTIVREQLTPYGVQVETVSTSRQALALLKKDAHFDVVTLDFMMPDIDGAELGRLMKANPDTCHIPLVMITSAPNRGDKQHLEQIGFAAYLSKPLTHWHLRDALAVIIEAQRNGTHVPMITQHNLNEARRGHQHLNHTFQLTHVHVLLAEDNMVNQQVATTILEKYGCVVTHVADGEAAVAHMKHQAFDMVFMDCQMPVLDGYEATSLIRQWEEQLKRPRTPIIALTAHALQGDKEKCLAVGMDDYIAKPIRQHDIEQALATWIAQEKQTGERPPAPPKPRIEDDEDVLDEDTFNTMVELIGKNAPALLVRHLDVARGYVDTIQAAMQTRDFKAMQQAAHPLKSSSAQIGAVQAAAIAGKVEHMCVTPTPDITELQALIEVLVQLQHATTAAINKRLQQMNNTISQSTG